MLLTRSTVVFIAAAITYHAVTSGCTSCSDGYNLTYFLPMFEKCDVKIVNGSEVQLIPKLIPRRFGDNNCYGHGIPPGYRICRIPGNGITEAVMNTPSTQWNTRQGYSTTSVATTAPTTEDVNVSNCSSNPCKNGGNCTEIPAGYRCLCTTDFYGPTCSCPLIYTPDVVGTRQYTFPGLYIASGITSFDFEVSAYNDVHVGLSSSDRAEDFMYEIVIGGLSNTVGGIRRCIYVWGYPCDFLVYRDDAAAMGLSQIPLYDHYQVSFADGHIRLYRYDNQVLLMEFNDPEPLEINYVGIWTGFGSVGYWKFPSLC